MATALLLLLAAPGCSQGEGWRAPAQDPVELGAALAGNELTGTVSVGNDGEGPVELRSFDFIDDDGGAFERVGGTAELPVVLEPGEGYYVEIRFESDDLGTYWGTLLVEWAPDAGSGDVETLSIVVTATVVEG